ncbi:type IV pilus assembly protein FimV [Duganella hordei]|uniref:type IV pilus assembly protein FimV n=1 Tax=Duganella hordei TaxID=2865934 RepID=UPI0030E9CD93
MQQRTPFLTSILAGATALLLAAAQARAAELGDVTVRSFIGQPLAADIELVQLAPDEVSALQVKLAQPDVFRGANITMNPALGSVHMSIYRRDGRQFLHVTTTRNIDAEYVHLFLELSAAGRQDVRAATVWLQVDPNPAPPPPPVQVALPAARAAEPVVAAPAAPVAAVPAVPAAPQRARPAPLPSAHESEVGKPGDLKAAAGPAPASRRVSPPAPVAKPAVSAEPARAEGMVPLTVAQALLPLPPLPLPKGVKRPADPAACAPSGMTAKECVALDGHSAALSSKLVELEGKVKMLQGALGAATSPARKAVASPASPAAASASASQTPAPVARAASAKAASAATAASAASVASGGASAEAAASVKKVRVLPKLKYKKEKDKPAESGFGTTTMIAAGAGLLLLLGAGGYVLLRKKRGSGPLKIWQGFRKKKPVGEGGAPQEAQPLHEVTPESMLQP